MENKYEWAIAVDGTIFRQSDARSAAINYWRTSVASKDKAAVELLCRPVGDWEKVL